MRDQFSGASILLVEDDADIRELLATLLRIAGFEPTICNSAEVALEQLREQAFDLVLTDYALPRRTGGWLLQQAAAEGLLEATPALVVTAHPDPQDVAGYELIAKPFDLDDLVSRVKRRLDGGPRQQPRAQNGQTSRNDSGNGHPECPDPVELILYVGAQSAKSAAAIANIKRVLSRFDAQRVRLTIWDLSANAAAGTADPAALAPTLVNRSPGPRTFILSHITNSELIVDLLHACGEEMN
jgi:DNA-binding NtrC family response regulator